MAKNTKNTKATPKHEPEVAKAKLNPAKVIGEVAEANAAPKKANGKKNGDQKPLPEATSGDQKDAPAKAKKITETVVKWREMLKAPPKVESVITILKPGAKRGRAKERFAEYKSGMSIAKYQEVMKGKDRTPKATMSDVCWDIAAGFISIK